MFDTRVDHLEMKERKISEKEHLTKWSFVHNTRYNMWTPLHVSD